VKLPEVSHREKARRFSVRLGDDVAYLSYEKIDDKTLDYAHVWVPVEHRNRGIAAALTNAALQYAENNAFKIVPTCPYVAAYVRRHGEFANLVTDRA